MADITRGDVLQHSIPFLVLLNGTVSKGDPIGNNATGYVRADSDPAQPISCMAFALEDGVSGDIKPACKQCVQQTSSDLTTGGFLFLSATAGRIADAAVGATGDQTQPIGWVVKGAGTELMYLNAELPYVVATGVAQEATLIAAVNLKTFFIADRNYRVYGAMERHSVAGIDSGAVTLTVEKLISGTAKGSGVNVLSTTFNLKSTADTPVWLGPSATAADIVLIPGDALGLLSSGTLTSVVDTAVSVFLLPNNL